MNPTHSKRQATTQQMHQGLLFPRLVIINVRRIIVAKVLARAMSERRKVLMLSGWGTGPLEDTWDHLGRNVVV